MNEEVNNNNDNNINTTESKKLQNKVSKILTPKDENEDKLSGSKASQKQNNATNNNTDSGVSNESNEHSNSSSSNDSSLSSSYSNSFIYDLAVLNELAKSCNIAMSNISYLAEIISNKKMKKELVAIYSQYANILLQIDQHFEKFGEVPERASDRIKTIGICSLRINTKFDKSPSHIAEIMIQGLNMGIIKCQKLINGDFNIEQNTLTLLNTFLDFQKENIEKLKAFL